GGTRFEVMVPRATTIPVKRSKLFRTASDNQTSVSIDIYEGERGLVKDNHLLGKFILSGIPPGPRGQAQIEVVFDIDANSILSVSATEKGSGAKEAMKITSDRGGISKEEIERMIKDAERNKEQDAAAVKRTIARNQLENEIYSLKSALSSSR